MMGQQWCSSNGDAMAHIPMGQSMGHSMPQPIGRQMEYHGGIQPPDLYSAPPYGGFHMRTCGGIPPEGMVGGGSNTMGSSAAARLAGQTASFTCCGAPFLTGSGLQPTPNKRQRPM